MDIVQDVYNSLEASTKEVQKIVAEQNDLEEKVKNGRYSAETVQNEIKPRIDDLKRKTNALSEQAIADAAALVSKYRDEIEERYCLDPGELNDDIKLLQAGIPLSVRDVQAILRRNENNKTMTALALRYAEQHDLKIEHSYTFERELKAARDTADALDQVLIYYPNWIGTDHAFTMLDKFFALN